MIDDKVCDVAAERRLVGRLETFWSACRPTPDGLPEIGALLARLPAELDTEDQAQCVVLAPGRDPSVTVEAGVEWTYRFLGEGLAHGAGLRPDGTPQPSTGRDSGASPHSLLGLLESKLPELYRTGEPVRLQGADRILDKLVLLRAVALPLGDGRAPSPAGCVAAANMKESA